MKIRSVIINLLLAVCLTILIPANAFAAINQVELNLENLGIEEVADNQGIRNIAIFGLSVSDSGGIDTNRSDMILIMSLDSRKDRICLTSILRDSKVPIDGYAPQKINAAYKYGGPELAIKTLNQQFHLDISDVITVNFEDLINIVDYFGGIEIELTEAESQQIMGTVPGWNLLNGEQALLYASIRYIDSDYYRASRQQTVLLKLFDKIKDVSRFKYPVVIKKMLECMETSLGYDDILQILLTLNLKKAEIVKTTVPDINYETDLWGGLDETGSWVYVYDTEKASDRIHHTIYN